jgi:protein-S-isoprenylcysteine O-methyltransferase Ste14
MIWRWPGPRGEAYVALQFVLIGLIFFSPFQALFSSPNWGGFPPLFYRVFGSFVVLYSTLFSGRAARALGKSLTPLPRPKKGARLVGRGAYAWIRHPIYTGILGMGLGWSLAWQSSPALLMTVLLFCLLDRKARREEGWLADAYPGYSAYQRRTRRFLPWIY